MASQDDVREIALSLPDAVQAPTGFHFGVRVKDKVKSFAWVWQERIDPKKPRLPNPAVLAVRVASLDDRAALIAAAPGKFFTEPHYQGFPAVLVRLAEVKRAELRKLLEDAHRTQLPGPRRR